MRTTSITERKDRLVFYCGSCSLPFLSFVSHHLVATSINWYLFQRTSTNQISYSCLIKWTGTCTVNFKNPCCRCCCSLRNSVPGDLALNLSKYSAWVRGQFNKTFTPVTYKCSYCSQTLKTMATLVNCACKSFNKLTTGSRSEAM